MPNNITHCQDCIYFGRIQHKQEYFCRYHGGLAMITPETWCCYGKPRQDVLERKMKGE